jgi:hypothetical protein
MGKGSLNGASRGSITGSQVGVRRAAAPVRPVVTSHVGKSVNTHPKAKVPKSEAPSVFDPINTGLSNTQQAAIYNATGGKY